MEEKVIELEERVNDLAGRLQTAENRLIDLAKYLHQGFTRGNLHPPQPADPEHDSAKAVVTYECTKSGCGARSTREVHANASCPQDTPCVVCGTIAKLVATADDEEAHTVRYAEPEVVEA